MAQSNRSSSEGRPLRDFLELADRCARLRILADQVRQDIEFIAQDSTRLIIAIDTDCLQLFFRPESRTGYVDPFSNLRSPSASARPPDTLSQATAYMTGIDLLFGAWQTHVIALPAYDLELFDSVRAFRRDAEFENAQARLEARAESVPHEVQREIARVREEFASLGLAPRSTQMV